MKKIAFLLVSSIFVLSFIQRDTKPTDNFKSGEFVKYRVHHTWVPGNAGFATIEVKDKKLNGRPHYHMVGKGGTKGAARAFFKVDDRYESYIDKTTKKPSKFIRKIDEGGYTKDRELTFNHKNKSVRINDKKHKKVTFERYKGSDIQDVISAFYFLRNYDTSGMKAGDEIKLNIFMDAETFDFKLKILGRETKKTDFGKIKCLKIQPFVKEGRTFKQKEGVTVWVTDDKNHLPVEIKAELAVGALKAQITEYKNLKYPIKFIKK